MTAPNATELYTLKWLRWLKRKKGDAVMSVMFLPSEVFRSPATHRTRRKLGVTGRGQPCFRSLGNRIPLNKRRCSCLLQGLAPLAEDLEGGGEGPLWVAFFPSPFPSSSPHSLADFAALLGGTFCSLFLLPPSALAFPSLQGQLLCSGSRMQRNRKCHFGFGAQPLPPVLL